MNVIYLSPRMNMNNVMAFVSIVGTVMGCIYQCKDTNFKANHNKPVSHYARKPSCIYQCKDTNFNAITTNDTPDLLF